MIMKSHSLFFRKSKLALAIVILTMVVLSGCATTDNHRLAFSSKTSLTGNSNVIDLPSKQAFTASKMVLLKQGFTIDTIDTGSGLMKASRSMQDLEDKDYSYHITLSGFIAEDGPDRSVMTLSASQQTIAHKTYRTWWKLLWLIPIFPTETKYESIVVNEGNISDENFYGDFFAAVKSQGKLLNKAEKPLVLPSKETDLIKAEKQTVEPVKQTDLKLPDKPAAAAGSEQNATEKLIEKELKTPDLNGEEKPIDVNPSEVKTSEPMNK
jgi:outer membrane murein-binding lipoprotein Lpp